MASPDLPNAIVVSPKRRTGLTYRLRTVLYVLALLCIVFAWIGNKRLRVLRQRQIVAQIKQLGGTASFDYQLVPGQQPLGNKDLRYLFGDDLFAHIEQVEFPSRQDFAVGDEDIAPLRKLPRLRQLYVSSSRINDKGLTHIARFRELERLILGDAKISATGLAPLEANARLKELTLRGRNFDDESIRSLDQLPQLRRLYLENTNLTSQGLATVGRLTNLETLQISDAPGIADEGLKHLEFLKSLRHLGLGDTSVTDLGMPSVAALTMLSILDLKNSKVGDEGLGQLKPLRNLEALLLDHTPITNSAADHLRELNQLYALSLRNTAIDDSGFLALSGLTNLHHITVAPHISLKAAQEFHRALPNCRIEGYGPTGADFFIVSSGKVQVAIGIFASEAALQR